jgi:hypothetical protein
MDRETPVYYVARSLTLFEPDSASCPMLAGYQRDGSLAPNSRGSAISFSRRVEKVAFRIVPFSWGRQCLLVGT